MKVLIAMTLLALAACTVCKPVPGTPAYSPYAVPAGNAVGGAAGDGGSAGDGGGAQ